MLIREYATDRSSAASTMRDWVAKVARSGESRSQARGLAVFLPAVEGASPLWGEADVLFFTPHGLVVTQCWSVSSAVRLHVHDKDRPCVTVSPEGALTLDQGGYDFIAQSSPTAATQAITSASTAVSFAAGGPVGSTTGLLAIINASPRRLGNLINDTTGRRAGQPYRVSLPGDSDLLVANAHQQLAHFLSQTLPGRAERINLSQWTAADVISSLQALGLRRVAGADPRVLHRQLCEEGFIPGQAPAAPPAAAAGQTGDEAQPVSLAKPETPTEKPTLARHGGPILEGLRTVGREIQRLPRLATTTVAIILGVALVAATLASITSRKQDTSGEDGQLFPDWYQTDCADGSSRPENLASGNPLQPFVCVRKNKSDGAWLAMGFNTPVTITSVRLFAASNAPTSGVGIRELTEVLWQTGSNIQMQSRADPSAEWPALAISDPQSTGRLLLTFSRTVPGVAGGPSRGVDAIALGGVEIRGRRAG